MVTLSSFHKMAIRRSRQVLPASRGVSYDISHCSLHSLFFLHTVDFPHSCTRLIQGEFCIYELRIDFTV